jgi:WD40-like Beta Propeller Repeat
MNVLARVGMALLAVTAASSALAQNRWGLNTNMRVVETPHFRVLHEAKLEPFARRVAAVAERMRQPVIDLVGNDPGRVTVGVFDDKDFILDFSASKSHPYINIMASMPSPSMPGLSQQAEDWLSLIFAHEYVHIAQFSRQGNYTPQPVPVLEREMLGIGVQGAIGNSRTQEGLTPLWFIEGLAVYLESNTSSGGRNKDAGTRTALHQLARGNALPSLAELNSPIRPGGKYLHGAAFMEFLINRFGRPAIRKTLDHYNNQILPDISAAWEGATGQRLEPLYDEWQASVRSAAADQQSALDQTGLPQGKTVAIKSPTGFPNPQAVRDQQLVWWDEGRLWSAPNGNRSQVTPIDPSPETVLFPDRLSWTSNGDLVYSALDEQISNDVYRIRNGQIERLTINRHARDAVADGECILFVSDVGDDSSLRRLCDRTETLVWQAPKQWHVAQPIRQSTGKIALTVWRPGGFLDIAILNNNQLEFVTSDRAQETSPFWGSDGALYWTSDRSGSNQLYVQNAQITRQLTAVPGGVYSPVIDAQGHLHYSSISKKSFKDFEFFEFGLIEQLPTGLSVTLERNDPVPNPATLGLEYTVGPYTPDLRPLNWSIKGSFWLDALTVGLSGIDEAEFFSYDVNAGYLRFSDRQSLEVGRRDRGVTHQGLGINGDFSFQPTTSFGLDFGGRVGYLLSNPTADIGWNAYTTASYRFSSSISASFSADIGTNRANAAQIGWTLRPELKIQDALDVFGSTFEWSINPYVEVQGTGFEKINAGVKAAVSNMEADEFSYATSGFIIQTDINMTSGNKLYAVAATSVGGISFNLSLDATDSVKRPNLTEGQIRFSAKYSIPIEYRPNGMTLERLTIRPFLEVSSIGFGGAYGGGLQILTDITIGYFLPLGIGAEVAYLQSNDPLRPSGFLFNLAFAARW